MPPTSDWSSADDEHAMERVERIIMALARHGAPIRAGTGRRPPPALERARRRAEQRADDAGRAELLAEAREMVTEAYVSRLGDAGLWVSLVGTSVPYSAEDRAASQAAILDLVTAAVTEDLLEPADVRRLREDGSRLLDHPTVVTEMRSTSSSAPDLTYRRQYPAAQRVLYVTGAVFLVALVFLVVAGATEDLVMAFLVAIVVVLALLLSVVGPSWWERRGRTR